MIDEILELIENKQYERVKDHLKTMFVQDIADLLEEIDDLESLAKVFKLLPKDKGAEVFSYVDSSVQEKLVNIMTDSELSYIIEDMYVDDAVDFLEEMPANFVDRVLKNSTKETRQSINKLLRYKEDSAGSVMTTEFLDLKEGTTISDALERIRKEGKNLETINIVYVTDKTRILKGVLSIRDILLAEPNCLVEDLMNENVIYANTSTDQEEVALMFKQYDILALPVVDNEKRLVGIVTVDDVVHIMEEEATEDIEKMAAITPNDKPYLKTSVFRIWLNRVPWLLLLMISATFTGLIITQNEAVLSGSRFGIILTACIPMLMDTGGNAGGQASATIIRGMALGEIEFKDIFKVMWKEFRTSILLGISLAIVCFLKLLFIDNLIAIPEGTLIAGVVCVAMVITVIIAKLIGCVLPMLAKKCKLDPAVMASPFITTIVDALSLIIFCNMCVALLPVWFYSVYYIHKIGEILSASRFSWEKNIAVYWYDITKIIFWESEKKNVVLLSKIH